MNKISMIANTIFIIACAFLIQTKSFAEPANLGELLIQVKQYHDSGLYSKEIEQTIAKARQFLDDRVVTNQHAQTQKKLALVLDIDETSLSNYDQMIKRQFVVIEEAVYNELKTASGSVIEPTLELYNDALQHNVAVFFITGRTESLRAATETNLKQQGYTHWADIYFRPDNAPHAPTITYKSKARALIEQQGYTIIASIGDQQSDLLGGHAEKTFKLPNPYYYIP